MCSTSVDGIETEGGEAPAFWSNKQIKLQTCLPSFLQKTKVPVSLSLGISTCGILSWISEMKEQFWVVSSLRSEQETATRCSLAVVCNHQKYEQSWPSKLDMLLSLYLLSVTVGAVRETMTESPWWRLLCQIPEVIACQMCLRCSWHMLGSV